MWMGLTTVSELLQIVLLEVLLNLNVLSLDLCTSSLKIQLATINQNLFRFLKIGALYLGASVPLRTRSRVGLKLSFSKLGLL